MGSRRRRCLACQWLLLGLNRVRPSDRRRRPNGPGDVPPDIMRGANDGGTCGRESISRTAIESPRSPTSRHTGTTRNLKNPWPARLRSRRRNRSSTTRPGHCSDRRLERIGSATTSNPASWAYLAPIVLENNGWALFITTARGRNHAKTMLDMAQTREDWFSEVLPVNVGPGP